MYYNKQGTFLNVKKFKEIHTSFELKNEKKTQMKRMWMWGWHKLSDKIKHWEITPDKKYVSIPAWLRWFWEFEDRYPLPTRVKFPKLINPYKWNKLDLKQDKAVDSLLKKEVGLLHASTWVWKTNISAKIIKELEVRTLIVVSWIELMNQMKKDLKEVFWITYKTLSGSKTKQKTADESIIIANIDTLVKQYNSFFEMFDLVILDEVDTYFSSDTRREMMWKKLNMKYIYWLTGTIKINYIPDKIFDIYFWPKTELLEKHFNPEIKKIMTEFTYQLDDMKKFHELKEALYTAEDRNDLIIKVIKETLWNNKWIVFSEYINHAKLLKEKIEANWIKCFLLIWEVKDTERQEIKKQLIKYNWPCVLIGSVKIIWRWFNVPELSVWYLTTCEKFTSNISQYVWRIIRKFEWKTEARWFDFIDPWCKVLLNQSKSRSTTYRKEFPSSSIEFYKLNEQQWIF